MNQFVLSHGVYPFWLPRTDCLRGMCVYGPPTVNHLLPSFFSELSAADQSYYRRKWETAYEQLQNQKVDLETAHQKPGAHKLRIGNRRASETAHQKPACIRNWVEGWGLGWSAWVDGGKLCAPCVRKRLRNVGPAAIVQLRSSSIHRPIMILSTQTPSCPQSIQGPTLITPMVECTMPQFSPQSGETGQPRCDVRQKQVPRLSTSGRDQCKFLDMRPTFPEFLHHSFLVSASPVRIPKQALGRFHAFRISRSDVQIMVCFRIMVDSTALVTHSVVLNTDFSADPLHSSCIQLAPHDLASHDIEP